jgi:sialate O-acetylesterase
MGFLMPALLAAAAHGQSSSVKMNELFQDHAVLERDRPIVVWGRARPGDSVTVALGPVTARAQADASGTWRVVLPAMGAGGPLVLSAQDSSGDQQLARDVVVGDVFLCSGQSNMQLPVRAVADSASELRNSPASTIRMLQVAHAISPTPRTSLAPPVSWQNASGETVASWSAACFFFARELQRTVRVPIGLIQSSWDGSNIRPWMSAQALKGSGGYDSPLELLKLYADDADAGQSRFARQWEEWWRSKTHERAGEEPWSAARTVSNDKWHPAPAGLGDWRGWGAPELESFTGLLWYRTHINLTAAQVQATKTLALGPINQVDETWINGRAVGNTFGYESEREYRLSPGLLHAGDNLLVVNVLTTYGAGGLLGAPGKPALQLASGASIALPGPWEYRMVPAAVGYPPRTPWESVGGLTTIYNAMIAPLGEYGLRGVLWYQGESNTGEPRSYQALLSALMADWRRQFGAALPFLIVQLPNYGSPPVAPQESGWAQVREAQREAVAQDPHAALAVTIDIGDPHNLHPTNKQEVGRRLARAARHVVYGEAITPSGPVAVSARHADTEIVVEFADVEGTLVAYSHDTPIGFELCAATADSCRYAAARIEGAQVVMPVPAGLMPSRVRYCWGDSPVCTLFDRSGLPAGPFELTIR